MARYRYAPLKSNKHENTWSNLGQNASTTQTITLAEGTDSADVSSATEVEFGHKISWIYLEFHFSAAQTGNVNVVHWRVYKKGEGTTIGAPNLYYQDNKNKILKRGMEMIPTSVSTVFKRVFTVKLPRSIARIGKGDTLALDYIASSTQTINACGIAIYKEIY